MSDIRFHCVALLEVMEDTLNHLKLEPMVKLLYDVYLSPECFEFVLSQFYTSTFRSAYKEILKDLNIASIYHIHDKSLVKNILTNVAIRIIKQRRIEIHYNSEFSFGNKNIFK